MAPAANPLVDAANPLLNAISQAISTANELPGFPICS